MERIEMFWLAMGVLLVVFGFVAVLLLVLFALVSVMHLNNENVFADFETHD